MILDILKYPDKRLRTLAKPVETVNTEIKQQIKDMFETMYDAPGIGLAATQVNFHQRIIVIDVSDECNQPLCLINPEIIEKNGEIEWEEGCLSVPNYYESVTGRLNDTKGEHTLVALFSCFCTVFQTPWPKHDPVLH